MIVFLTRQPRVQILTLQKIFSAALWGTDVMLNLVDGTKSNLKKRGKQLKIVHWAELGTVKSLSEKQLHLNLQPNVGLDALGARQKVIQLNKGPQFCKNWANSQISHKADLFFESLMLPLLPLPTTSRWSRTGPHETTSFVFWGLCCAATSDRRNLFSFPGSSFRQPV